VKRRVLIAALAMLLAVLGAGAVLAYVHQAVARAVDGQKAATALVAQQAIPSGTSARAALADGLLHAETLPADSVPANAVRSVTPVLAGLVTSAQVAPGQLLLRPMLVTTAQVTGGVALPRGMVAITMAFCMPEAVAGGVHAGSTVEIFDTAGGHAAASGGGLTASPDCSGSHQEQGGGIARTRVVLPRVQVLSVGPASASSAGGTSPASTTGASSASASDPTSSEGTVLVTFAVGPAAAQQLIQLTVTGLPYLALLQP
jgi:pilus assembly protein CpaB